MSDLTELLKTVAPQIVTAVGSFVVALVVTAWLGPKIKKKFDRETHQEQKRFENELALSAKLRDNRDQLLGTLSESFWQWQFHISELSYYIYYRKNQALFEKALDRYDGDAPKLLASLAVSLGRIQILAPTLYASWKEFEKVLLTYDTALAIMAEDHNAAICQYEGDPKQKIDKQTILTTAGRWLEYLNKPEKLEEPEPPKEPELRKAWDELEAGDAGADPEYREYMRRWGTMHRIKLEQLKTRYEKLIEQLARSFEMLPS